MASNESKSLRSALGEVRGLGAAKHGTEHWWAQRVTSVALIPLTIWFVLGVISHLGAGYPEFVAWMKSPFSAAMMILTVSVVAYHAYLGLQVVIEDYIHVECQKIAALLAVKFLAILLATACIVAVLKLTFGA